MESSDQGRESTRSPSIDTKRMFVLSAIPQMAEHTFPFLCSIIGIGSANTGRLIGSGLRCTLQGRRAVLTALHVVQEAARESAGVAVSVGYGRPPFVVYGPVNIDPVADLAVYFLPQDFPDDGPIAFWPSDRMDRERTKLSTDYLFLHGFPGSRAYSSQLLQGVVSRSLPYGAMQRIDDLPRDLEPVQFAMEYDPAGMSNPSGVAQAPIDPRGLSGSPVWRIGVSGRSARSWQPSDSLLVGVVTQWRPQEKVLVATSVSEVPSSW